MRAFHPPRLPAPLSSLRGRRALAVLALGLLAAWGGPIALSGPAAAPAAGGPAHELDERIDRLQERIDALRAGPEGAAGLVGAAGRAGPAGLEIESPAAVLIDPASGEILFEKNGDEVREPASTTKLMALLLTFEAIARGETALDRPATVSEYAVKFGGRTHMFEVGEQMPLEEFVIAVALASANDAAIVLAEHVAGTEEEFVARMNERARELGMRHTRYMNPHGLPAEGHVSTARDLALLSSYVVAHHPEILRYTGMWEHWIRPGRHNAMWLTNTNRGIARYKGMDGLKTGWTNAAGYCLAATAQRDGRRLVAVVMGSRTSEQRNGEIYKLLNWGFTNTESLVLARSDQVIEERPVAEGVARRVPVRAAENLALTLPRGKGAGVERRLLWEGTPHAPVAEGQRLGRMQAVRGEELLAEVPLVAAQGVPRLGLGGLFGRIWLALWPQG